MWSAQRNLTEIMGYSPFFCFGQNLKILTLLSLAKTYPIVHSALQEETNGTNFGSVYTPSAEEL